MLPDTKGCSGPTTLEANHLSACRGIINAAISDHPAGRVASMWLLNIDMRDTESRHAFITVEFYAI